MSGRLAAALAMNPSDLPRLTVAFGLHGSASTWVFNVARDLLSARVGPDAIAVGYGEKANALLQGNEVEGRHVLLKCHRISRNLGVVLWLARAPILISIRDPRDATLSMAQRFGMPFAEALDLLAKDAQHVATHAEAGHPIFRYEDGFVGRPATVVAIGRHLGIAVGEEEAATLVARYDADAVRRFGARFGELPPSRRVVADGRAFDRVTQIHPNHVGDGRVGKWRDQLDAGQQVAAERAFGAFLDRFGYR